MMMLELLFGSWIKWLAIVKTLNCSISFSFLFSCHKLQRYCYNSPGPLWCLGLSEGGDFLGLIECATGKQCKFQLHYSCNQISFHVKWEIAINRLKVHGNIDLNRKKCCWAEELTCTAWGNHLLSFNNGQLLVELWSVNLSFREWLSRLQQTIREFIS